MKVQDEVGGKEVIEVEERACIVEEPTNAPLPGRNAGSSGVMRSGFNGLIVSMFFSARCAPVSMRAVAISPKASTK